MALERADLEILSKNVAHCENEKFHFSTNISKKLIFWNLSRVESYFEWPFSWVPNLNFEVPNVHMCQKYKKRMK